VAGGYATFMAARKQQALQSVERVIGLLDA
jgi:hypothetical protein